MPSILGQIGLHYVMEITKKIDKAIDTLRIHKNWDALKTNDMHIALAPSIMPKHFNKWWCFTREAHIPKLIHTETDLHEFIKLLKRHWPAQSGLMENRSVTTRN